MKSRDVVGRRIVEIAQTRVRTNAGYAMAIDAIVLDDGTRIGFRVHETPGSNEYAISASAWKDESDARRDSVPWEIVSGECRSCGGRGRVSIIDPDADDEGRDTRPCRDCNGTGRRVPA